MIPGPADLALNAASAWIGPVRYHRLTRAFGGAAAVLAAPPQRLQAAVPQLSLQQCRALLQYCAAFNADKERADLESLGAEVLRWDQDGYPRRLSDLGDPPALLHVLGRLPAADAPAVAIVGTRKPSPYGLRMARSLAEGLARAGVVVVSGLAKGIDGEAHAACLDAGGCTVAVMGTGLGTVYPAEHRSLAARITAHGGALVSQFSCNAGGGKMHFPMRNAVISGLSLGVVVVEGNRGSGSLITADLALEQGREVFAVPGCADEPLAQGPLDLLQLGARLVRGPEDVLEELGLTPARARVRTTALPAQAQMALGLAPDVEPGSDAGRLWQVLQGPGSLGMDQACTQSGLTPAALAVAVTELELLGAVRQAAGARIEIIGRA